MGNKFLLSELVRINQKLITMKKIIYLCLLALLAVSFGCEKEGLYEYPPEENLEKAQTDKLSNDKSGDDMHNSSSANQTSSSAKSSNESPTATTNSTTTLPGNGNDVYYLYLNMDAIEDDYNSDPNNPSYTGPFNIYYRNLMSNNFTIYHIQESTNNSCGNIERWIVDFVEFNQYLVSIGLPEVDLNGEDWYMEDSNTGGETSTTMTDVNGKKKKGTPPPPPPPPPNVPSWLVNYINCFTL